jgi:hypothetical protein
MLLQFKDLSDRTKREVRDRFNNWKYDTTVDSFGQWANLHAFYVKRDGTLNNRFNHCEPSWMAPDELVIVPEKAVEEPFIWLNDGETNVIAGCGCKLKIMDDGNPAFFMCEKHAKGGV